MQFNTPFFHLIIAFLSMMSGQLSEQLKADLQAGNCFLDDQVLELKKEISGGSIINLIDGTTNRVDGICSFDKNILQTGRAFAFSEVSIMYATTATTATTGAGEQAYVTVPPKELQNATFVINQNGREVLRYPVIDLMNLETANKAADEYTELRTLRLLADDKTITLQLVFPPNVSLSSGVKHFISLRLKGLQTTKKPA